MAPTTTSTNLAQRAAAASRADAATAAAVDVDSQNDLARSAPTLADTLQASHIRWRLHAGWAQRLATTDERFGHWLADGQATLVKHGTNRLVYRVDSGDVPLYVKRYRHRRGLARLAPLVRGSPARREWNKALELSRRGIPTALPVALGEDVRAGIPSDSLLVTREIPASQSLDQFLQEELPRWTATEQRATRRWLACSLARLIAATHRAGVRHDDLHAGNILVNLDAARRPHTPRRVGADAAETNSCGATSEAATTLLPAAPLFLIDLPGVSFGRPLGRRASLTSLVMLAAGLFAHSTPREQWRFWQTYLASRPDLLLDEPRAVAQSIVPRVLAYQRALARSRDRRALATNRDFRRLKTGRVVCHAVQELSPYGLQVVLRVMESGASEIGAEVAITSLALGALAGVEKVSGAFSSSTDGRPFHAEEKVPDTFSPASALPQTSGLTPHASFSGATAGLPSSAMSDAALPYRPALIPNPDSKTVSFEPPLVLHHVPAALWPRGWLEHPARRAWRLAQALASRGIATERPLAALVPRWFAPWRDGYLVFPATASALPLAPLLASLPPSESRDARRLAEACGAALGQLHRWQVNCPALSIGSFAVRRKSDAFEIVLTDWAHARLPRWTTARQAERRALHELATLHGELRTDTPVSRTWLARALRAYVAMQLREPAAWRKLWRQLAD